MRWSRSAASLTAALAAAGLAGGASSAAAPKQPTANAVTLQASSTRVVFGRTSVLSGQVTGNRAAGAEVTIEHTPAPFTAPFAPAGATATADAAGAYSVTVTPSVNTRYQAVAKTKPPATSSPVQVDVAPKVRLRLSDTRVRRGGRVRFYGRVLPAHDGATVQIQRRTSSGFRTVAQAVLEPSATAGVSKYGKRLRVRRTGVYRAWMPADADHVAGKSRRRRVSTS